MELLSPDETLRLLPAASAESLFGSVWVPADGFLDPHTATYALANAARALGRTGSGPSERVTAIELDEREIVRAIRTEHDRVECEIVVDAGGDLGAAGGGDGGRAGSPRRPSTTSTSP